MTSPQALALLLLVMGALFVALGVAPLAFFDRIEFWHDQAKWFRANRTGSIVGRALWGGFGLFVWVMAVVVVLRQ
jgi:hypothetical protein